VLPYTYDIPTRVLLLLHVVSAVASAAFGSRDLCRIKYTINDEINGFLSFWRRRQKKVIIKTLFAASARVSMCARVCTRERVCVCVCVCVVVIIINK